MIQLKPSPLIATTIGAISAITIIILYNNIGRNRGSTTSTSTSTTPTPTPTTPTTKDEKPSSTTRTKRSLPNHDNNNDDENKDDNDDDDNDDDWSEHIPSHMRRELLKERRRRKKLAYLAMKSPMYDNVQMFDSKGVMLAKISKKKAKWYVNKGLAHYCNSDDMEEAIGGDNNDADNGENKKDDDKQNRECIQLDFQPKDNSNTTLYSTADKENICVKCGRGDYHLMRHHIVPSSYKSLLPQKFKSHMSHDITLLCGNCHLYCQQESQRKMTEIETLCRPPDSKPKYTTDETLYKVRSSALALMNWKHKIPKDQLLVHYQRVIDYMVNVKGISMTYTNLEADDIDINNETEIITKDQLQELIDIDYKIENPDFIPGPVLVVKTLIDDEEKIGDFVRSWRRHFLETVHPRFLPDGWSVDHHVASNSP